MPKSNSALNKFNKDTPESIQRRQFQELVANEFNDARSQVIKRLFESSAVYAELFDKQKNLGNTMIDFTIGKALANYTDSIEKAKERLDNNESKPFSNIFSSYSTAVNAISAYVNSQGSRPSKMTSFESEIANTAPKIYELLQYAFVHVSVQEDLLLSQEDRKFDETQPEKVKKILDKREALLIEKYLKTLPKKEAKKIRKQMGIEQTAKQAKIDAEADDKILAELKPSERKKQEKADQEETDRIQKQIFAEMGVPEAPELGPDGKLNKPLDLSKEITKPNLTDDDLINLYLFYETLESGYNMGQSLQGRNLATVSTISGSEYLRIKKIIDEFRALVVSDFNGIFKEPEPLTGDLLQELNGPDYVLLPENLRRQTRDQDFVVPPAQDMPRNPSARIEQPYEPLNFPRRENGEFVPRFGPPPPPPYSPLGREGIDFNVPPSRPYSPFRWPRPPYSPLGREGIDFNPNSPITVPTGRGSARGGRKGVNSEMARSYELIKRWSGFPYFVPPSAPPSKMVNPRSRVNNRTEANGMPSGSGKKKGKKSGKPKYTDI